MFLPTIVASFLTISIRILNTNCRAFQPWHALTRHGGAVGHDSPCLPTRGRQPLQTGLKSLMRGQPVVSLANGLLFLSALMVPLSTESISLDLIGSNCQMSNKDCVWVLSASPAASRVLISLLITMAVIVIVLTVALMRWHVGVDTNPWSICSLASLSRNPQVRSLVAHTTAARTWTALQKQIFKLDQFLGIYGQIEYGIVSITKT
ncbi:hypothetical protein F5Y16DRAFT_26336 [Xylariaceae sp. FL0255]|nr:hypothetical protein F5Y16DRAFT_26336 [Xylariaceae sp. FL0255]